MKTILEKIDLSSVEGINAFIFEHSHFDMTCHYHLEYELTLILESSGERFVGNDISEFKPGDLVLLGGNLPHCWRDQNVHPEISKALVVQWEQDMLPDQPILESIQHLLKEVKRGLKLNSKHYAAEVELMHSMIDMKGVDRYLALVKLLHAIATKNEFEYIVDAGYIYDPDKTALTRIEKVQLYVHEHFQEKIKLSEVAAHLHMNEQAFSRFFSKTMKKPFFQFLNEYRINRACRLILETDLQMSEIAYECGYDSLPFFYKQFKKFKGFTPLEMRKKSHQ